MPREPVSLQETREGIAHRLWGCAVIAHFLSWVSRTSSATTAATSPLSRWLSPLGRRSLPLHLLLSDTAYPFGYAFSFVHFFIFPTLWFWRKQSANRFFAVPEVLPKFTWHFAIWEDVLHSLFHKIAHQSTINSRQIGKKSTILLAFSTRFEN